MSSSVARRRPRSPSGEVAVLVDRRRCPSTRHGAAAGTDRGERVKLQIHWKAILQEVLVPLKGTNLTYTTEETIDSMFQVQASFSLPMDSSGVQRETVSVTGKKCFSTREAESEAAAAALQHLASGPVNIHFMDISQIRCEQLKLRCEEVLARAGENFFLLISFLSDWDRCTRQIQETYEPLFNECDGPQRKIKEQLGRRLAAAKAASLTRLTVLQDKLKDEKTRQWDVRASLRKYFNRILGPKVQSDRLEQARTKDTKIGMRTILFEMMISLGWHAPSFSTWRVDELWGCEVELDPKGSYASAKDDMIRIESIDKISEAEATESAAREAILYLERVFSIYLVDINYNQRAEAESHLAEAVNLLESISSLVGEACSDWEGLLEDLSVCDEHCYNSVMDHELKDHSNQEYNAKRECAEAAAQLFQLCVSDLQQARKRKTAIFKWLKEV